MGRPSGILGDAARGQAAGPFPMLGRGWSGGQLLEEAVAMGK